MRPAKGSATVLKTKAEKRSDISHFALDDFLAVGVGMPLVFAEFIGRGHKLDYRVEQGLYADIGRPARDQRWETTCVRKRLV